MTHRLKLTIAGIALFGMTGVAHAQSASSQIDLSSTVLGACGLGTPDTTVINLGDLTGPNGLLDASKKVTTTLASATIADAWCNTSHRLTIGGQPMTLQRSVPYAQPANMTRHIAFDAKLVGWIGDIDYRPRSGNDGFGINFTSARAAPAPGLQLNISNLETMTAARVEQPNLMLEYGTYKGTITITLAPSS
ncbi:hypothetical protein [Sphingopyxis sp. KK2]|uniref:hypothetical protein n=1 Tax=Sphingopyxis sp. KK2 TaxID=1855727 RepID=UPI00097E60D7|nr:hypothetical protein [Sphingopyxis sp. KK2]